MPSPFSEWLITTPFKARPKIKHQSFRPHRSPQNKQKTQGFVDPVSVFSAFNDVWFPSNFIFCKSVMYHNPSCSFNFLAASLSSCETF